MIKKIIVLAGLPGSGKTHWARHQHLPIIAVDDVHRTAKTGMSPSKTDNRIAREQAYACLTETLKTHDTVIFDHTNINTDQRKQLCVYLRAHAPDAELVLHFFDTDFFTCLQQNTGREFDLQPQNIFYLALALEWPTADEDLADVTTKTKQNSMPVSSALKRLLDTQICDAAALRAELPEIGMLASVLEHMGEHWAADVMPAWQELKEAAAENRIDLLAERELVLVWLLRDLHRIVFEYFAVAHPEAALPNNEMVYERMYEIAIAPRVAQMGLDARLAQRLFIGIQRIRGDEDMHEADYTKDDIKRISLLSDI